MAMTRMRSLRILSAQSAYWSRSAFLAGGTDLGRAGLCVVSRERRYRVNLAASVPDLMAAGPSSARYHPQWGSSLIGSGRTSSAGLGG